MSRYLTNTNFQTIIYLLWEYPVFYNTADADYWFVLRPNVLILNKYFFKFLRQLIFLPRIRLPRKHLFRSFFIRVCLNNSSESRTRCITGTNVFRVWDKLGWIQDAVIRLRKVTWSHPVRVRHSICIGPYFFLYSFGSERINSFFKLF